VTKCLPRKKVHIKERKKWDLAKLENGFLTLTFWGAFCHEFAVLESAKNPRFF
jgi:hypothetical protein